MLELIGLSELAPNSLNSTIADAEFSAIPFKVEMELKDK